MRTYLNALRQGLLGALAGGAILMGGGLSEAATCTSGPLSPTDTGEDLTGPITISLYGEDQTQTLPASWTRSCR